MMEKRMRKVISELEKAQNHKILDVGLAMERSANGNKKIRIDLEFDDSEIKVATKEGDKWFKTF